MGLGGISVWQLLIVLAIVILVFGTKRLKGLGGDLGGALKSFKSAMNETQSPGTAVDDPLAVSKSQSTGNWADMTASKTDKSAH